MRFNVKADFLTFWNAEIAMVSLSLPKCLLTNLTNQWHRDQYHASYISTFFEIEQWCTILRQNTRRHHIVMHSFTCRLNGVNAVLTALCFSCHLFIMCVSSEIGGDFSKNVEYIGRRSPYGGAEAQYYSHCYPLVKLYCFWKKVTIKENKQ